MVPVVRWLSEDTHRTETESGGEFSGDVLVDRGTLDRLAEDVGREILPELIEKFLSEMDTRIELIEKAAESMEVDVLSAQAHPLKSSAANFGAVSLSRLASRVEALARAGDGPRAMQEARRIGAIAQETRVQLMAVMPT